MCISSEWKVLPDGSTSSAFGVWSRALLSSVFEKQNKTAFHVSSHEHLSTLLTICCRLKRSFDDPFHNAASPCKQDPASAGAV